MAKVLLIETSTGLCSVGLAVNGKLVAIREDDSERLAHAEKTNFFIEEVCHEAGVTLQELDAVAVGGGPGSYTGLRIGTSIAKGLCFSLDKPLIGIPSLLTIASGIAAHCKESNRLLVPMIDARRNEVYAAVFDRNLEERSPMRPLILDDEGYASLGMDTFVAAGDGAEKVENSSVELIRGIKTSVRWMAELAEKRFQERAFEDLAYYVPVYGKPANALKPKRLFGN